MPAKAHSAERPHRVTIPSAGYADGCASISYRFCWDITGDETSGHDYVTETRSTKIPLDKVDVPALRMSILAEYADTVEKWDEERAAREGVEAYIDAVLLN